MKLFTVLSHRENLENIPLLAEQNGVNKWWWGSREPENHSTITLLVSSDNSQQVLDSLYGAIGSDGQIIITTPDAVLPHYPSSVPGAQVEEKSPKATREELYNDVENGAKLSKNFMVLVALSTIVATIGLIKANTAVVIGAMVIAPLLGPNLALAFATALGDYNLMLSALKSNFSGLGLATLIAFGIGIIWPADLLNPEIHSRTVVGYDSMALALASGAAAALSLTTGLSGTLVGVMVAVALLPPAATLGMLAGSGNFNEAMGAGLLLAVNIVCVNLSAKIVFLVKGIKPRTWLELEKAKQSTKVYLIFWFVSLAILIFILFLQAAK